MAQPFTSRTLASPSAPRLSSRRYSHLCSHCSCLSPGIESCSGDGVARIELVLAFTWRSFLYPLVTKVAFEGFPCYSFDEGRHRFLMTDVSIRCGSDEHSGVQLVAWIAVIVYPHATAHRTESLGPSRLYSPSLMVCNSLACVAASVACSSAGSCSSGRHPPSSPAR